MNEIFSGIKRFGLVVLVTVTLTGFLSACGSTTTFDTIEDLKITLMTNPKQPVTGDGELVIYLTRSNGQSIDNVEVDVSATASGMKTDTQQGKAVGRGGGMYFYPMKFHMQTRYDIHLWVYRNGIMIAMQESTITV